jgi:hypothetical protein
MNQRHSFAMPWACFCCGSFDSACGHREHEIVLWVRDHPDLPSLKLPVTPAASAKEASTADHPGQRFLDFMRPGVKYLN